MHSSQLYIKFYLVSLVINRVLLKISGRVVDSVVRKSVFNIIRTRIKHGVVNYNRSKFFEMLNSNNDPHVISTTNFFSSIGKTLLKFRLVVPKSLKESALFW